MHMCAYHPTHLFGDVIESIDISGSSKESFKENQNDHQPEGGEELEDSFAEEESKIQQLKEETYDF